MVFAAVQTLKQVASEPTVLLQILTGVLPVFERAVFLEKLVGDSQLLQLLGSHRTKVGAEVVAAILPLLVLPTVEVGRSVGELVYGVGIVNAVIPTRKLAVEFLGSLAGRYAAWANVPDILCAIKPLVEDIALFSATLAGALKLFENIELIGVRVVLEIGKV